MIQNMAAHGYGVQLVDGTGVNCAEIIHSDGRPVIVINRASRYVLWTLSHAVMALEHRHPPPYGEGAIRLADPALALSGPN